MPRNTSEQVTERVLALAAYIRHERIFTLDRATLDVPGYPDADRVGGEKLDTSTQAYEALRSTFRRDLEALKTAFGIEAPYDSLEVHYQLRPPFFTPAERRALIAAAGAVAITFEAEPDGDPEVIGAAIGDDRAEVFLTVSATALQLLQASQRRAPVRFTHKAKVRRLEPWLVGPWRRHWYVIGHDLDAGARRTYRIERISDVEVLEGTFEVPADFDRDAALDMDPNRWGTDPRVRVAVEVEAAFADRLADAIDGEVVDDGEGRTIVEADAANRSALIDRVLELGSRARIVSPPEVVEEMSEHLRRMAG